MKCSFLSLILLDQVRTASFKKVKKRHFHDFILNEVPNDDFINDLFFVQLVYNVKIDHELLVYLYTLR